MKTLSQYVKQYSLLIYFVLAYIFAWAFYPLIKISATYGVPGLFAPAAAAIMISWLVGRRQQVSELLGLLKIWRVNIIWYVIALGLPVLLTLIVALLSRIFGADPAFEFAPITPLALIIFVLVVGEEIGWAVLPNLNLKNVFRPL